MIQKKKKQITYKKNVSKRIVIRKTALSLNILSYEQLMVMNTMICDIYKHRGVRDIG
jgi:hypothetical protein